MTSPTHLARPVAGNGTGVLVLAGSSGRLDVGRAEMLASCGVTALALSWFGGEGQPSVPREVPLETFADGIDRLLAECSRVVLLGLSYGAEAALLTATIDRRVDAVVALAPTDVAWEGQHEHPDDPRRSKWTHRGVPVPFVPLDRSWEPPSALPAYVELYERSRELAGHEVVEAATIPVERIRAEVLLVAGGTDRVWASTAAAGRIAVRRRARGLETTVVVDPAAGHPVVLPGEVVPDLSRPYAVGGDEGAPQRLGALAWPEIRRVLRIEDAVEMPRMPPARIAASRDTGEHEE
ncbi:alpha/beta fold hydrolase [Nocardioides sp. cx-173]|uniref:alpha/beta fold hydrolase n=1 Tax=Nocardioides sp. cx-173 TaxID=2898796 RepID=UPI001E5BE072|nr:alpha/beta fold hydrolase [Nocardioides sp. cx-173]MCD4526308.1 alpha/beta fold hydrolase [Nocardioides sp. cx-173]UGB43484.1 alpha/beta fold hydrolase [Nocardioides sp. cx-173]